MKTELVSALIYIELPKWKFLIIHEYSGIYCKTWWNSYWIYIEVQQWKFLINQEYSQICCKTWWNSFLINQEYSGIYCKTWWNSYWIHIRYTLKHQIKMFLKITIKNIQDWLLQNIFDIYINIRHSSIRLQNIASSRLLVLLKFYLKKELTANTIEHCDPLSQFHIQHVLGPRK